MGPLVESVEEGRSTDGARGSGGAPRSETEVRLGLFENPYVDVDRAVDVVHSQANQDLALRAGREGIVLLKNEKALLPLKKDLNSVAVIGPDADDLMNQLGDYSPKAIPQHVVTILEGIKAEARDREPRSRRCRAASIGHDKSGFAEAIRAAKNADVAIVVVGENRARMTWSEDKDQPTDGEGHDIANLDLTGVQEDLVHAVFETGTPTVVVLVNGRPLSTRWTAEHVPAIVEAWRPGERGGKPWPMCSSGITIPAAAWPLPFPATPASCRPITTTSPRRPIGLKEIKRGTWICPPLRSIPLVMD